MTEESGDRLSRWSRMKLAAQDAAPEPAPEPEAAPEPEIVEGEIPEDELLEKLGLPDPDTLKPGDDFSAFMPKSVPDFLRRRALRRLWTSNPLLANVDGLVDYGDDFTDAAMVPEVLNTVYQVGRGMVAKVEKALEDMADPDAVAAPTEGDPEDPAAPDAAQDTPEAAPQDPEADDSAPGALTADAAPDVHPPDEIVHLAPAAPPPEPPLKPRRMRFQTG